MSAVVGGPVEAAPRDSAARPDVDALRGGVGQDSGRGIAAGELPTPASNTGVTVAWQGIHWFAGSLSGMPAEAVAVSLGGLLGAAPVALPRGGLGYERSFVVGAGGRVYWSPGRPDVHVSLPGEACESVSLPDLASWAIELGIMPNSRLDVAWDIEGITPGTFDAAFRAGDVVTRIHRDLNPETGRMRGIELRSNHEGDTVYLGSRSSERFIRVYDRRGPTRLEAEYKGNRALALWAALLDATEDGASKAAMAEVRAFIDFRARWVADRPDACPLLDWWEKVVDGAGRSSVKIPRKPKTLEDVTEWVRGQVAPSFAMLRDGLGLESWTTLVKELLRDGRSRYIGRPDRVAMVRGAAYG